MPQDTPPVAPNTATRRRGRNFALSLTAALAAGAAYVGACALVPLPAPTVEFAVPQEQRFAVDDAAAQAAVDAIRSWIRERPLSKRSPKPADRTRLMYS